MISKTKMNHLFWKRVFTLIAAWVVAYGGTHLVLKHFGLADQAYSNLTYNTVFLLVSIGCIRLFRLSAEDVGLKIIRQRLAYHVGLCLSLFALYWLYYLFGVRISGLRPFTSATVWGLLNYIVVAFVEEIYFRGLWYHLLEKRYSGGAAVLVSGLLFGLVHFRQGLGMLPKFFTGWLWGSIRYATGMISLLIPVHFTYDAVWLLFEGRWNQLPTLAYFLPLVELLMAILIVFRTKSTKNRIETGKSSTEEILQRRYIHEQ